MKNSSLKLVRFVGSVALALAALGAHAQPDLYHTVVFEDSAQGEALVQGQIEEAIASLTADQGPNFSSFEINNNLCVAYMAAKDLSSASVACDAAVRTSTANRALRNLWSTKRARNNDRAVALLNRGVLNALNGDIDSAREDFSASARLDSRLDAPRANLSRLLSRATAAKSAANR